MATDDAATPATDASTRGFEVLDVEQDGHVATLFLDRPEKRNALGPAFFEELPRAMAALADDDSVRCLVIAARGPHFTVGLDLHSLGELASETLASETLGDGADPDGDAGHAASRPKRPSAARLADRTRQEVLRLQGSITAVATCPKPVIAAVHGYCIGGGVDLITACDIRVASADAVFSVRETRMAIVADLGSLQRLPLILPMGHVAELAYTGKDISAERAERIGLVNHVYDDAEAVLAGARGIAAEIAANSPLAVRGTKEVLGRADRQRISDGLDYVAAWNAGHLRSDDLVEAVLAFMEKRTPSFEGR